MKKLLLWFFMRPLARVNGIKFFRQQGITLRISRNQKRFYENVTLIFHYCFEIHDNQAFFKKNVYHPLSFRLISVAKKKGLQRASWNTTREIARQKQRFKKPKKKSENLFLSFFEVKKWYLQVFQKANFHGFLNSPKKTKLPLNMKTALAFYM